MQPGVPIAIVGAGPYGLSLAAHLKARGVAFAIFGKPMDSWKTQMPRGMRLKSEGFASSLADPADRFTLAAYCREYRQPYADIGLPVPIETFIDYGMEFQRRFAPDLDQREVTDIKPATGGFKLTLTDGDTLRAAKVVVAVGVGYFPHMPAELADIPPGLASHSSRHADLEPFNGKDVIVLGAGSSAVDLAGLLYDAGASVRLVARRSALSFHAAPERGRRALRERLRYPRSGLGIGWRSRLCTDLPLAFRAMPQDFRHRVVRSHLGPAGGWFAEAPIKANVPCHLATQVKQVTARGDKIYLQIENEQREKRELEADHVVAATGYRPDLSRLPFMSGELLGLIRSAEGTPVLSSRFESSVPGLFFVGPVSANIFGPLMRFSCGNRFVARRLAPYVA